MHHVGRNEYRNARSQRVFLMAYQHRRRALEHEDLMFVRMGVLGGAAAWGKLELTHRKARRAILFANQTTDLRADGPLDVHRGQWNALAVNDFHKAHPSRSRIHRSVGVVNKDCQGWNGSAIGPPQAFGGLLPP